MAYKNARLFANNVQYTNGPGHIVGTNCARRRRITKRWTGERRRPGEEKRTATIAEIATMTKRSPRLLLFFRRYYALSFVRDKRWRSRRNAADAKLNELAGKQSDHINDRYRNASDGGYLFGGEVVFYFSEFRARRPSTVHAIYGRRWKTYAPRNDETLFERFVQ